MVTQDFNPKPGNQIFNALRGSGSIIMACNTRVTNGITKGIFRAAKKAEAVFFIELAHSECDLNGGYTGLTPQKLADNTRAIAEEIGYGAWALHADHTAVKKGTSEEIQETKKLLDAHVKAGYTSFAIDASFLFDTTGKTVEDCLTKNIEVTTQMVGHIREKMSDQSFGLEVEVGEIGYHDNTGKVKTKPEEAVAFLKGLAANDIRPDVLAIANGSAHGNVYDVHGTLMPQLSIDLEQTRAVATAIRSAGFSTKIAQHGITGTPRDLIKTQFPHKDILKGNVGTMWQNIVWDVLKVYEPGLFARIRKWTLDTYTESARKKGLNTEEQIFGLNSKQANKVFFDDLYSLSEPTVHAIESVAYAEALQFFEAFNAFGTAKKVLKQ